MLSSFLKKSFRWGIAVAMLAMLSLYVVRAQDATSILTPGTPAKGTLNADAPVHVYAFTGTAGQTISVDAKIPAGGVVLLITDANGAALKQQVFQDTTASLTGITLPRDGTYYVTLSAFAYATKPAQGDFELTLTVSAPETTATPLAPTAVPATTVPVSNTPVVQSNTFTPPGQFLSTTGIQVSLSWANTADLNLNVRDPLGNQLYWESRTTPTGGTFGTEAGYDANGLCQVLTNSPKETASWPAGAITTGSYEILVFYRQPCQNSGTTPFTINVTVNGVALPPVQGALQPPVKGQQDQVFVNSFIIAPDGSVRPGANGIYGDINSLPAATKDLLTNQQPITPGTPVTGTLTDSQSFQTFSFSGKANEIVSVSMQRTAGSLDTLLLLLDPQGNVIDSNDDTEPGKVTDSIIRNHKLPVDGVYTIVATRYAKNIGGTEGTYELALSGATEDVPQAVKELNLPAGDIQISLTWSTAADLQLLVRDPSGDAVFDDTPIVPSGGRLVASGNVNCTRTQTTPVSYIYWPQGFARAGSYEVEVWYQNQCNDPNPVEFTLSIVVNGKLVYTDIGRPTPNQKYVTSFTIDLNQQVQTGPGGFVGGSTTLNYQPEVATAPQITPGQNVTGSITPDNKFDVYTFQGTTGEVVSIGMNATAGTLDPTLFLISPTGVEIASNDDADPGKTTNSLINKFTLPADGQYVVIATHFATVYGGTTGTYTLTLTKSG